jgi:ABC-type polysaccharide/polyol phosphate transport system ATPase subunit
MIRPGEIAAEHVSRRFKVYPREARRLKDVFVGLGRTGAQEVVALRDVSFRVEPGSAVGLVGRNGSGKTTLLRVLSGIIKPSAGHAEVGGRIGSLLELGAGFHPELTGRENVFLNGSIHGLKRSYIREQLDEIVAFAGLEEFIDLPVRTYSSGMYMRLGFAIAAHIDADVLLLDEVFAVGDEQFQRKCFGKIFEFKQRGGTIVFVSHDAAAVERLCDRSILLRGGTVEFDGPTHDAIVRYRRLLAADRDPEERGAGLKEWGSGEARLDAVELLGPGGEERTQFLSGEPLTLRVRVAADAPLPPPRLSYELRDSSGLLLAGGAQSTGTLGWEDGTTSLSLRYEIERLPLANGRFHLRLGLSDEEGGRLYHWLDDALAFVVVPAGEERGTVRIEGRWSGQEIDSQAERLEGDELPHVS